MEREKEIREVEVEGLESFWGWEVGGMYYEDKFEGEMGGEMVEMVEEGVKGVGREEEE